MPNLSKSRLQLSGAALICAALAVLMLPLKWIIAAAAAALWHEFCHWAAVSLCGGKILHFRIGESGAVMESQPLSSVQSLICSLAGPVGSLSLLILVQLFPRTALCGLFQGVYNLLPIYPLDGGRALRTAAASLFTPKRAGSVCRYAELSVAVLAACICLYFSLIQRLGFMPLLLGILFLLRIKREKLLAN